MKLRTLLAGAGLCILAAVAIESADRYLFRQAAAAVAARVQGLTFAGIRAEPWQREARIDGLDWRRDGASLHAGALKFTAPPFFSFAGAALAGLGAASADDVTFEAGPSVYRIKRIELAGPSISSGELMRIFDQKNAAPLAERLATLTAASIAIPEMSVETRTGTATQILTYRDILLNGVSAGKAADASIGGISFSIQDPQAGDADGAYGRIGVRDVDLVLAAKIVSETRDQADAPKLALFNAIDIDGFHLGGAYGGFDVRRLTAAVMKGRPPLRSWREAAAQPSAGAAPRNPLLAAFLDSFESSDLTAMDVRLNLRKDENPVTLTIERASAPRVDGARIDLVEVRNLAVQGPSGRFSLEDLSFRGLDLRPLTNADRAPSLLGEDLRPDFEQIALRKLEARFGSSEEDAPSKGAFAVERFEIDSAAPKDPARPRLNVSLEHFTAPIGEGGAFSTLAAMGYERLDLSSRFNIDWSEASSELAVNSFALDGADMGSLDVAAQFSNVTSDLASRDERIAAAAARSVVIKKLDLRVENAGLFNKALAVQAKNEKQSVDEARQSDILRANLLLPALLGDGPPARALGSAIAKFIAAPKNFSLQALAPEGIGVADLELVQTPGALLKKIEITAAANQ